jgi:hypothetical protein
MDTEIEFYREEKLMKEKLLPARVRRVKVLGHNLVLGRSEVNPVRVGQDGNEVRNLLLHANMRVIAALRILNKSTVQIAV